MGFDAGEVLYLMAAGKTGGDYDGVGFFIADGGQEHAFADGLGNIVMLFLVSE